MENEFYQAGYAKCIQWVLYLIEKGCTKGEIEESLSVMIEITPELKKEYEELEPIENSYGVKRS